MHELPGGSSLPATWPELLAFLEVAQSGSVSEAAEALHITQPAVTKRLQALEMRLNTALFDRVNRRLHVTPAGRLLEQRTRDLLAHWHDTARALENLETEVSGRLSLATSHHIGLRRLAPVLREFSQSHHGVQLDIRFEDSEDAHALVRDARSELAIVTLNPQGAGDLAYETIWDDPLIFVARSDSPLCSSGPLQLVDLLAHPVVLPGMSTYTGRIVVQHFAAAGLTLRPDMSTNYLETIGMLVSAGLGWSVLPRSMLAGDLAELPLSPEAFDPGGLHRTLGAVTNPRRTLSNAAKAMLAILRRHGDSDRVHV